MTLYERLEKMEYRLAELTEEVNTMRRTLERFDRNVEIMLAHIDPNWEDVVDQHVGPEAAPAMVWDPKEDWKRTWSVGE